MAKLLKATPKIISEIALLKNVSVKNISTNTFLGQAEQLLVSEITKNLPFSKILFLQTANLFFSSGLKLIERLKKEGIKVINVLIDETDLLSLESVCGIFRASEEVRGVVALGETAFNAAKYYSSVSGARFFAVAYDFLPFGFFNPQIYIKNGKVVDNVNAPQMQSVIFEEKVFSNGNLPLLISSFLAEGYFSLIDAKLSGVISEDDYFEIKKKYFHLVDLSFLNCTDNYSQTAIKFLRLFIDYSEEFHNRINGKFISCLSAASFLYHGGFKNDHSFVIRAALRLFSVIESFMGNPISLESCDFRQRVDKVKTMANLEENAILESLVLQERQLYGKNIKDYFGDNVGLWKLKKILNAVTLDSDYDEQKFIEAVKHCGDTTLNINTASFLRHIGALEKV